MTPDPDQPDPVVLVQPAASVMVIADRPGLEVLLLLRRAASAFVGGMIVFPGGAVDESDRSSNARRIVAGDVDRALRGTGGSGAHIVAAVRETLEETGIWLGAEPERPLAARQAIDAGERLLSDVASSASVNIEHIPHAGRWITPPGAPRRYDTQFFVARADHHGADLDHLEPDGREVVALEWSSPADAVRRTARGALAALEPTVVYLEALARYESAEEVIDAARRGRRTDHRRGDWTTI